MNKFKKRPSDVAEGNVEEIRVSYDQYGIVGIQQAPLDDGEYSDVRSKWILENAISAIMVDMTDDLDDISKFSGNGYRTFYVSLVRNFMGSCLAIRARSEEHVRKYALNYLGKMWCTIYDTPSNMIITGKIIQVNEDGVE